MPGFIRDSHAVGYHVLVLFLNSDVIEIEERGVGSGSKEGMFSVPVFPV